MQILFTKYFEGKLSPKERAELFDQLDSDPLLTREFIEMQYFHALISWLPTEADEAEAVEKLLDFKLEQKKKKKLIPWKHVLGYSAAIIIAILSSWIVINNLVIKEILNEQRLTLLEERETTYEEFTAPAGQRALIKLQDGTTVWLNAKTTLRYPNKFSYSERRVELDGEAFFDVKKDEQRPFIVSTNRLDIKVTGTCFNVFAYQGQEEFNTSLTEGTVWVYNKRDESKGLLLNPNERAILSKNRLYKEPFTQMDFLLWKDGIYAFDNMFFSEIIEKLQLYYDISIIVENKKLQGHKFSGKFRQRDGVESVLRTLRNIRDFNYEKDDETNVITIK